MGRMPWAVYLWPGLPHLWRRGAWSGLAIAIGFAILLNLALVSSLIWTELELLRAGNRMTIWFFVGIAWIGSAVVGFGWERRYAGKDKASTEDDSFGEALDEYLQQNWYEAEQCLTRLLRRTPRDLDARLMLAAVLHRTGRLDEAAGQLDRLSRMEGSRKWELEISHLRQWLARAVRQLRQNEKESDSDDLPTGERLAA